LRREPAAATERRQVRRDPRLNGFDVLETCSIVLRLFAGSTPIQIMVRFGRPPSVFLFAGLGRTISENVGFMRLGVLR